MKDFRIVILAAGKGNRMGTELPKALISIAGKPLLQHLIERVKASGLDDVPLVVVGHGREHICERFGAECEYVVQEQQLGTGHAVSVCQDALRGVKNILVLYGDHPLVSKESIQKLVALHTESRSVMTATTTIVPSFDGWYRVFMHWGRILRDASGRVIGNRQFKDATEDERMIKELDPALYCFQAEWLFEHIFSVKNANAQGEYYLTDLVQMAVAEGHEVPTLLVPPEEAIGINTPEEKAVAEELIERLI